MSVATSTNPELQVQTLEFTKEVQIAAPIDITWESVLAELGEESQMPDGKPFPMRIEPWPGGRWLRDLGKDVGHLWGHVQVIKPPGLLEVCGPMLFSYPALNHRHYRLTGVGETTRLKITHRAWGWMPKEFLKDIDQGWSYKLENVGTIARRRVQQRKR
jgi:hypothetical protein